jgi:tetratricopeptide (TPR) repeat protein
MGSERGLPRGLWFALAAGVLLRAWYFADLARQPWYGYPLVDSLTFDRTALGILAGGHPGGYFRPPLYPHLLAGLYAAFGHRPGPVIWIQFLLGLAALLPAYLLARRWFGGRAALAGAWIGAVYPLRIFFEGELLDVTLFTFLFLWGTWYLWRALEDGEGLAALLSGLLLGAAATARPNLLLALPFMGVAGARALGLPAGTAARRAVPWVVGVGLALAPTALHNWRAEGAFIPVAANGGVNLYLGNAPGATGLTPVPPGLRWEALMQEPLRAGREGLAEQERYWYAKARAAVLERPGRALALLATKGALFFNAAESSNNKALGPFTAVSFPVRHYRFWYGALLCLAAAGCVASRGRGPVFLAGLVAGFALSVALFFVTERYRLPLVPLLAGAAGAGALALGDLLRSGAGRRAAGPLAALACAALAVFPDWFGAGRERINADFQMGQVRLMRGEPELALAALARARAADPADPDVLNSIGAAQAQRQDYEGADAAYRAALELGEFSEVWFNRGVVAERRGAGHREEALAAYRRALEINPHEGRARANAEALLAEAAGAGPAGR